MLVVFVVVEFVLVVDCELLQKVFYFYVFAQPNACRVETELHPIARQVPGQTGQLELQLVDQLLTDLKQPFIDGEWDVLIEERADIGGGFFCMHQGNEVLMLQTVEYIAHFIDDLQLLLILID